MDRELRIKVIKLSFTLLGYLLAMMFLIGAMVDFLIHLWLPALLLFSLSIALFLLVTYLYLGTSIYVIFEDSMYVPRLYRHGDAKRMEIVKFSDVKRVKRIRGFLRDGYLLYVSENGYYFVRKSVFGEIRSKLPVESPTDTE